MMMKKKKIDFHVTENLQVLPGKFGVLFSTDYTLIY